MYLSRIYLPWKFAANSYQWHQVLWQLFPQRSTESRDYLFRTEKAVVGQGMTVLLQSHSQPKSCESANVLASKTFQPILRSGIALRFCLRANPIKSIRDEDGRKNRKGEVKSCRVPLIDELEQRQWLERKLANSAALSSLEITPDNVLHFRKSGHAGKIQSVVFSGTLIVENHDALLALLENGIGPAKAFGCGLLSLANR